MITVGITIHPEEDINDMNICFFVFPPTSV